MPTKKHQMGGDEAPVRIWSLGWCRANSETDPLAVGFLVIVTIKVFA